MAKVCFVPGSGTLAAYLSGEIDHHAAGRLREQIDARILSASPERVVLDDGKFELLLIPSPRTPLDLQNLVLALLNQQYDSQGLVFRHVSSLRLETEEELPWSLDGEYAPSVPVVDIVNRQRALRMLL